MANHLNNDQQLDQAVKEALESYEVPFESSAWAEMEQALDTAPKTYHPFKKWSFSLNTIIAIAVLAGGLLIFIYSTSGAAGTKNDKENTAVNEAPAPAKEQQPAAKNTSPVVTTTPVVTAPQTPENTAPVTADQQVTTPAPGKTQHPAYTNNSGSYQWQPKKKTTTTASNEQQNTTPEQGEMDFMKMTEQQNIVPAFGDQIDPVRGFVHGTNESDKMKKLAESKLFGKDTGVQKDTLFSSKLSSDSGKSSEEKKVKQRKPKREKTKQSKDSADVTTEVTTSPSGNDASVEKSSDSAKVKRPSKNQTPKYKGEKTIIDP